MNLFFKKIGSLCLAMLIISLILVGCQTPTEPESTTASEPEESTTTLPEEFPPVVTPPEENPPQIDEMRFTNLGIPMGYRYAPGAKATCPWDMIVWENRLYIGGGDYGDNAGPVDMWYYDLEQNTWGGDLRIDDEEVSRFRVLDGMLVTPGIDPMDSWELGNYYVLDGTQWIKKRNIPGGIHNFDMIAYDGMIFCSLGVLAGGYPVACSTDGGETFTSVPMYRNDVLLDTASSQIVRSYDLFLLNGTLYATLFTIDAENKSALDVYRYEQGVFVYDNQWIGKFSAVGYSNHLVGAKTEFGNRLFFTTGFLYVTEDMENLTQVSFPNGETVFDLIVYDNCLYALCGRVDENGECIVSVWKNEDETSTQFSELFSFTYDIPAISFAISGNRFFFGMGNSKVQNEKNGTVLMFTKE